MNQARQASATNEAGCLAPRWSFGRTDKKDGKVAYMIKAVTSKDGKRFTADVKGKTPKGEPFKNSLVFERP